MIGDVVYGRDIGKIPDNIKFIYTLCSACKEARWVRKDSFRGVRLCKDCNRKNARTFILNPPKGHT